MLTEILFIILALIILIGGLKMLNADEPIHAAIYLGIVLLGVAGIYLTLGAEFLAAIQVLIYVGAVVTLILFAVMLTSPTETGAEHDDKSPLAMFGLGTGVEVESVADVEGEPATVKEAERAAQAEGEQLDTDLHAKQESSQDVDLDEAEGEPATAAPTEGQGEEPTSGEQTRREEPHDGGAEPDDEAAPDEDVAEEEEEEES